MKTNLISRICLILLALLMCAGAFASCGQKPGDTPDTQDTPAESTPPAEEPTPDRLCLVENGEIAFTIVYPNNASTVVMQSMNRLIEAIKDATGVRLSTKSDYQRPGTELDPNAYEILIGNTNRSESAQASEGLFADQFAIRVIGNKFVIASSDDSYILAAVNYFISDLLQPNLTTAGDGGSATLCAAEYTLPSAGADSTVSINGKYIYDYTIVYSTELPGYLAVANLLQEIIAEQVGYNLDVRADTAMEEKTCEILIGKTNRATSTELYAKSKTKLMNYELVIQGNKMQILCGGPYSARECANEMRYIIFGGDTMQYTDGSYRKVSLATSLPARAEGTDLRIMTSNILAARWGEDLGDEKSINIPPVEQRAEIYAAVLAESKPDAIGVQETDDKWVQYLPAYLNILKEDYGLEYTWLFSTMEKKANLTSIIYRSDLLDVVESDCQDFSYWQSNKYTYHLRVLAWARFRYRANPAQEFILLNTHWAWESPEYIEACVVEEIAKINELKAKGVPIFCTGDFNTRQDHENVLRLMAETGVQECMLVAKENGTLRRYIGGCGNVGQVRNSETYIDHIFGYGSFEVLQYETILGNRTVWLSDHSPQFADIKF